MEDGEDSAGGPSQRTHLAESSAETSAERSRQLATLRKGSFFSAGYSAIYSSAWLHGAKQIVTT